MTDVLTITESGDEKLVRLPGVDSNTMETIVTEVGTTPVQIEMPESFEVIILHQTFDGVIYVGKQDEVNTVTSLKLEEDSVLVLEGSKEQDLWARTALGTVNVLAIAGEKE